MMTVYHYIALGFFIAFALADCVGSTRNFPDIRFWRAMGIVSTILYFAIALSALFLGRMAGGAPHRRYQHDADRGF
jgi:hypothetical protein